MAILGKIGSLFFDKDRTKPLFPRTKVKAVSDDSGKNLDLILDELQKEASSTSRKMNSAQLADRCTSNYYRSQRDFSVGTLITTSMNSLSYQIPFLLEIKGNSYGQGSPIFFQAQGYGYQLWESPDTQFFNSSAHSLGTFIDEITVFLDPNGYICFWFPRMAYWQGFDVTALNVISKEKYGSANEVVDIIDSPFPGGTNITKIPVTTFATARAMNATEAQSTYTAMKTDTLIASAPTSVSATPTKARSLSIPVHSEFFQKISKWYTDDLWSQNMVEEAVIKKLITAEEKDTILQFKQ